MKRLFLLLVFSVVTLPVLASHIVGGEIELIHVSGSLYRINLIYYFDVSNNPGRDPESEEPSILLGLFRKRDNVLMSSKTLFFVSRTRVNYTQLDCSDQGIVTDKMIYSDLITLDATSFGDAGGYYISWERCCRNYNQAGLVNIVSQQPPAGVSEFPLAAGQTFYLEFPAVVRDGQPFINSSPKLFPPLSDYGCINKPYYTDFSGTDADGDSLIYSLVTPLSTINAEAVPAGGPRPGPYPLVNWMPSYSLSNIMNGAPDLAISPEGLLTVTPTQQGLYVFGVLCEEYRDGVKIGELRRDFQMFVLDCPQAVPPVILGKKLTDANFIYKDNMTVTFDRNVIDSDRCIEVQVSDKDIHNSADGFQERIGIRVIAMGFKGNVSSILPATTSAILNRTDSVKTFRICFDECPFVEGPFRVGIIAYDDACALPLLDTLRVTVNIEPPLNSNARFITSDVDEVMDEGDPIRKWQIEAVDDEGDPMTMYMLNTDVILNEVGMTFTTFPQTGQSIKGEFSWDPSCNLYDFSQRTEFEIKLLVEDQDFCGFKHPDTLTLNLKIHLPNNVDPIIDTDLTPALSERHITDLVRKINESLTFNVTGDDDDDDLIVLGARGIGFNLNDYSITFPGATGDGNVSSQFTWDIRCDKVDLESKSVFEFEFIVVDNSNKCHLYQADTVNVKVKVEPPDNEAPLLSMTSLLPDLQLTNNEVSIILGQQISIKLTGTDADVVPQPDNLVLELIEATGNVTPVGYIFEDAQGNGTVESVFSWLPECSIFENNVFENDYTFRFRLTDNKCFNPKEETIELQVKIKDVEGSDGEFVPNNFISPNGDGCNDYFAMDGMEDAASTCGEVNLPNLPKDNCSGRFLGIRIYNRWGKQIYTSSNRNFRWYASDEASGVYYYYMTYTSKEYKGTINVR